MRELVGACARDQGRTGATLGRRGATPRALLHADAIAAGQPVVQGADGEGAMVTTVSMISRGELRLLALAAVNDELGRAIVRLAEGDQIRLSGISFHDRIRLKEMELGNGLRARGILVGGDA
jgi:hypothetical protein